MKAIQQVNFTGNIHRDGNKTFFIIEETEETILGFLQEVVRVFCFYFALLYFTFTNTLIVKLSNSQLNKLKSGINYGTGVILNLSSNVIGYSNDETNFSHKLLDND